MLTSQRLFDNTAEIGRQKWALPAHGQKHARCYLWVKVEIGVTRNRSSTKLGVETVCMCALGLHSCLTVAYEPSKLVIHPHVLSKWVNT